MVELGLWREDTQTKCTHHPPRCGGDNDALTWGILMPQVMVGAKAAPCHGCCGKKQKRVFAQEAAFFLV
jgi:hypothetical protein